MRIVSNTNPDDTGFKRYMCMLMLLPFRSLCYNISSSLHQAQASGPDVWVLIYVAQVCRAGSDWTVISSRRSCPGPAREEPVSSHTFVRFSTCRGWACTYIVGCLREKRGFCRQTFTSGLGLAGGELWASVGKIGVKCLFEVNEATYTATACILTVVEYMHLGIYNTNNIHVDVSTLLSIISGIPGGTL